MAPGISLSRGAPVCCAAVENFVNDRHLNALRRKVSQSKTSIKNTWSQEEERRLQTSRRNVKREQVQGDRFADIEKENMRLLLKMQEIEHRGPAKAAASAILGAPPPACSRGGSLPPIGTGSKCGARMREMRRIDEDNQRLLKKLQGAKSSVNLPQLEDQHRHRQKVMRMRCEHQRPEWKEMFPPPRIRASQPMSPVASEGQIDAECERLLKLQEQLRSKMEAADSLSDAGALPEATGDELGSPSAHRAVGSSDSPHRGSETPTASLEMVGGVIPARSRALAESLLAEEGLELGRPGRVAVDNAEDTEEAALAAKEAAANALRMAQALDVESDGLLAYGDVVSRFRY
mmetsp:Transcript_75070/g.223751  ORF Transcript_75070/g.223751 Transcript_75070/m.223751 type:complete len:347 (-) Transcript_75070:224-1264(-)